MVNGATLTTDRFVNANSAYSFDGVSSYIQTTANGFSGNSARTFSLWINSNNNSFQHLISSYGHTGNAFEIQINNPCPGIGVDCASGVITKGNLNLINGNWRHCVLVFDPSVHSTISDVLIYIDGQLQSQLTCSALNANCLVNTTNPIDFVFGKATSNLRFVDGKLDDIGIWSRALNSTI